MPELKLTARHGEPRRVSVSEPARVDRGRLASLGTLRLRASLVVVALVALGVANIAHARAVARGRGRRVLGRARRRRDRRRSRAGSRGRRSGHPARRRAAGRQRRAGPDARRRRRIPASRPRGHARSSYTLRSARHAPGARGLARAGAARQLDVLRAGRGRPLHAAGRRVGAAAPARAIRRRCISSGCASRSSACSPSRSTVRSIASTGSFYWGDAVAMALLPPLLLHFTLVFPERPPWRGVATAARRCCVPLMYLPALGARRGSHRGDRAGRRRRRRCSRARSTCSIAPSRRICSSARSRRVAVLVRAFRRDHVAHRRGVSCAGLPGARRSASVRSRSATRCRGRSASNPPLALQLTAIPLGLVPLTFASAIVRYRLRDVEVIIKRGLAYTAFLGGERGAATSAMRKVDRLRLRATTPTITTGSSRCWRRSSSCCSRSR